MKTNSDAVRQRYALGGIQDRVDAFLRGRGVDPERANYQDYFPFDQLHGRGIQATREHIDRSGITSDMFVLDLGCGVGGSSRAIAATRGCRVVGVDITAEYVEVARELSRRCGMSDRIDYKEADALDLPFDGGTFDHVWCHNVTMNIQDKERFASEVARVLKRDGRFSCSELAQGPGGAVIFPVPWATDASASFLVSPHAMRDTLDDAGLRVVEQIDVTEAYVTFVKESRARAERGAPPINANYVVMGDDFAERLANSGKCAMEKRIVEQFILAAKP